MTEKIYEALQRASSLLGEKKLDVNAARLLLEFCTTKTRTSLLADMQEPLTVQQHTLFWDKMTELLEGKPVQYIIGVEYFYGLPFYVDKNVLIPRPETEELVYAALEKGRKLFSTKAIKMVDIGTGSGAIAVSFKTEWPEALVTATDISEEALAVAKRNSDANEVSIRFMQGDMAKPIAGEKWDIILSNPPYIAYDEASLMAATVVEHEPHNALFADEQGLLFYRKLAETLPALLNKPALIGMEIGYLQAPAVHALFHEAFPEASVKTVKDINGKDRMIFCEIRE